MTYAPTGGIVAAASTSLPERLGGRRNWDYRFCWLRDDTYTLLALMNLGYYDEARSWRDWLVRAIAVDHELNSFVQAYGSKRLDASLLQLPLVGFLPATDPRIRGTLRAIEDTLLVDSEFVVRYETDHGADGLPPGEGAFLACSFWLVDNYVLQGRYADARRLFERLLSRCNDVGLLAEEIDPMTGRMLGNFPQAYSHVGVNCALNLSRQKGPVEERAEPQDPSAAMAPVASITAAK